MCYIFLSVCLSACLSFRLYVCLSVCLSACLPAGLPACKKISSKIAKIKKLVTRTPVSTKRTNRVPSKNHTSGIDKIFFLSDLISRGLMGKHTEKSDQNSRKKILSTCWINWKNRCVVVEAQTGVQKGQGSSPGGSIFITSYLI